MRSILIASGTVAILVLLVALAACEQGSAINSPVPYAPTVFDCSIADMDSAPTLIPVGAGGGGTRGFLVRAAGTGGYAPPAEDVFSDKEIRQRAAMICACRAKKARESYDGAGADVLTVFGGVGTVGGGVVSGIAATVKDNDKRATLATTGAVALGVGAVAFGLNAALNLSARAKERSDSATVQEQAAAVLLNDKAQATSWGEAWLACTSATNGSTSARRDNPQESFNGGGSGSASNAGGAGTLTAGAPGGGAGGVAAGGAAGRAAAGGNGGAR